MPFPQSIVDRAWDRSAGYCECRRVTHSHGVPCNKKLSLGNRGREGWGKWEAHSISGLHKDSVTDCQILCWDCHSQTF